MASVVFKSTDPVYSQKCLNYATALYNFAIQYPNEQASTPYGEFVSEYSFDDLALAATWLYEATGNTMYLDDALQWVYSIPGFSKLCVDELVKWDSYSEDNNCWSESWTYTWNSQRSALFVQLASSLEKAGHINAGIFQMIAKSDTMGWVEGSYSAGGFAQKIDVSSGSAGYNGAGQFIALAYARLFPADSDVQQIVDWARGQALYLLGDNDVNGTSNGVSFVYGVNDYSSTLQSEPHHMAAHASFSGDIEAVPVNTHALWGSVLSGPNGDDLFSPTLGGEDVSIVANAALLGALAGNTYFQNLSAFEFCPDSNFPPQEEKKWEFYSQAKVLDTGSCFYDLEVEVYNKTLWPPRYEDGLSLRFYLNVSEMIAAGMDPANVKGEVIGAENVSTVDMTNSLTGPYACSQSDEVVYFQLALKDGQFWGTGLETGGVPTIQLKIGVLETDGCIWDASNDESFRHLDSVAKLSSDTPLYVNGRLVWGQEPACHEYRKIAELR
jgi:hypothetical protein